MKRFVNQYQSFFPVFFFNYVGGKFFVNYSIVKKKIKIILKTCDQLVLIFFFPSHNSRKSSVCSASVEIPQPHIWLLDVMME